MMTSFLAVLLLALLRGRLGGHGGEHEILGDERVRGEGGPGHAGEGGPLHVRVPGWNGSKIALMHERRGQGVYYKGLTFWSAMIAFSTICRKTSGSVETALGSFGSIG